MSFRDESNGRRAFPLPGSKLQYGPDKTVQVEHIDLHLTPHFDEESMDGVCTTTVRALDEDVAHITLDAIDLDISAVDRDGKPQTFNRRSGKLDIAFEPPIVSGERATIAVRYRVVKPRHGLFFVKPTDAYPNKVAHCWTQSQDENARYWFPCLDHPQSKQTTSTTVVVPKGLFALANGALAERKDNGTTTSFRYEQNVPHSTYLTTMVAGPFAELEQRTAGASNVPVWYFVLPGRESDGERSFGKTPDMIDLFEKRIGTPYPYARYSQIAVSDFIFGGMENTSATTQTDRTLHDERAHIDFSSEPLVSHELAHQWFGDLLTCRDWSHAWLNEGFATYFEAVWLDASRGYDEYLYDAFGLAARYLDEDADRYRRPIVCNNYRDPIEIFDRHLYEKGAAVLHMLRGELGEARFWRSIRTYVERNAQRNVETIDLIRSIEEATGRNLRAFFDQWVFRAGHPELDVRVAWDAKRKAATLTIDQKQTVDEDHPPYRFDVDLGFLGVAPERPQKDAGLASLPDERRIRVSIERAHETITIPLDFEPKLVRFDPGAFLLGSITYKLGVDLAAASVLGDPDVVARIRAARELAKDGTQVAQDALHKALTADPFWGVSAEVAAAAGATRAPWARAMLIGSIAHSHPKVRRAVVAALGNFRDASIAEALIPIAKNDESYLVRASALAALGRTRDPRAFEVLAAAAKERTWNDTVEAGALRGLAELGDARAMPIAIESARLGNPDGLRRAAVVAVGRIGELVEAERLHSVEAIDERLDDAAFQVQISALAAAESLGDARLLPTLDRLSHAAFDGRVRRDAMEAAIRVREAAKVPGQVSAMRGDIDELREEQRKLQEKIETLSRN
jgi:aminopeptidase N